jgi:nitroimidazol reductase NimA-like FMN-containing flavoprotein (pyridoxamine 5'-phosphate oxidase superfamily)
MSRPVAALHDPGDLGRRIAERRHELHLTTAEVAERAGMAADYIEYLEHTPTDLSSAALMRLARSLDMSSAELLGGDRGRPAGGQDAARRPVLSELEAGECAAHLAPGGLGRLVFRAAGEPVAHPVNFRVLDGDVVFRSTEGGSIGEIAPGEPVSFEVDRLDAAMSEGWSVLAHGTIRRVDDPAELQKVEALGIQPWAGGTRHAYFRLGVTSLTGRRIDALR